MLFNSIEFCVFLPIVFILYWFVFRFNYRIQNLFLVVASYVFYGWWDWRFLILIIISSLWDYIIGLAIGKESEERKRKLFLILSILLNIGLLGYFKYYNFFIDSFVEAFTFLGYHPEGSRLNIVLPVGISFYTFQTLSYTFDVYRRRMEPTRDVIAFFTYVSFFPQLVAGPIEKAKKFLPQFLRSREFNYKRSVDGLRQILWGFFKKVVIADNCAIYVNEVYGQVDSVSSGVLYLGVVLFYFQLYGDFSGYSDIAIGTGRLFGFNLMKNFDSPLFTRSPAEFWRKWHISLTSWFNDYLLKPLGGLGRNKLRNARNITIIFTIIGFWHGANWTFIVFGFINALLLIPSANISAFRLREKRISRGKLIPNLKDFLLIILSFNIIGLTGVFFRSPTIQDAFIYTRNLFSFDGFFSYDRLTPSFNSNVIILILVIFTIIEWVQRERDHALDLRKVNIPFYARWMIYYLIIFMIIMYGAEPQEFVYFQF